MALSTAAEFRDHLSAFSDYYSSLGIVFNNFDEICLHYRTFIVIGPPNPENVPEDGKLKSEIMIKENRRYYLDLKENARGRFLRVSTIIHF